MTARLQRLAGMENFAMDPLLQLHPDSAEPAVVRCRERDILIPTFAQQRDPRLVPPRVLEELESLALDDLHPRNLFRITWKNDPQTGLFGGVNFLELPRELTGVRARIFGLVGRFFPTGSHKVGAAFGCLAPRLVAGGFDPTRRRAVWPSTGNYCRGGAWTCRLLGCESIAVLPEEMSRERFTWLERIGSEVIATPGCESNVKEIYDRCRRLVQEAGDSVAVFNQFEEFGNGMWHYEVTGAAVDEVLRDVLGSSERLFAFVSATGSAGTLAAGDRLKEIYPGCRVVASEALQCPTLLLNGYGDHRIEGIGDKHVPWIHNVRDTDMVAAVDDEDATALIRLFNEPAGRAHLRRRGVSEDLVERLDLLGISGICNLISAVKTARWYELDERDTLFTVFTDSMDMYRSRLEEARSRSGPYTSEEAAVDFALHLQGVRTDHMAELDHRGRKRLHNLKYFTWIEQQGHDRAELDAQWYDYRDYWPARWRAAAGYDRWIEDFNRRTGLASRYRRDESRP